MDRMNAIFTTAANGPVPVPAVTRQTEIREPNAAAQEPRRPAGLRAS